MLILSRKPGDAIVTVKFERHKQFRRDGADLRVDVPIALYEAVLGGKVRVPQVPIDNVDITPGRIARQEKIPPMAIAVRHGQVLRIGKAAPDAVGISQKDLIAGALRCGQIVAGGRKEFTHAPFEILQINLELVPAEEGADICFAAFRVPIPRVALRQGL